jgi:hypothetical protein
VAGGSEDDAGAPLRLRVREREEAARVWKLAAT